MRQTLLSPVDLDIVLQWSEMQKMMDDLSETEEDSSSSADSYENMSASDIMSVAGDLDLRAVRDLLALINPSRSVRLAHSNRPATFTQPEHPVRISVCYFGHPPCSVVELKASVWVSLRREPNSV